MLKNSFNSSADPDIFSDEQVKAAIELEQMMVRLEKEFRRDLVPKDIIMKVLRLTCEYYDGDWSGVLDIQQDIGVWAPYWWYNARTKGMTPTRFYEFENVSEYPTWANALTEERTLNIPLVDTVTPEESESYKRLSTKSVIAAPYYKGATGFIAVRNPKKFVDNLDLLKLSAYIASCEFHDYRLIENTKHQILASGIESNKDVCINLFGGLEIFTAYGAIRSDEINKMQIAPIIVYLCIHRNHAHSPREIAEAMYPDYDDYESFSRQIKHYIFRFRQTYEDLFGGEQLIVTEPSGYRLNSNLNIKVDTDFFDEIYKLAKNSSNKNDKIRLLEKAVNLYKNDVYPPASMEHWLMPVTFSYSDHFFQAIEELFRLLDERQDYTAIHEYAVSALKHHSKNGRLYYWLIVSMIERGMLDLARREYSSALRILEPQSRKKLKNDLSEKYEFIKMDNEK